MNFQNVSCNENCFYWGVEKGWTSSTHEACDKFIQNLIGRSGRRDHLGDLNVDGEIILKWMFHK